MAIFLYSVSLLNSYTESKALPLTQYQNVLKCIYTCIYHRCLEEEMMQLMWYHVCVWTNIVCLFLIPMLCTGNVIIVPLRLRDVQKVYRWTLHRNKQSGKTLDILKYNIIKHLHSHTLHRNKLAQNASSSPTEIFSNLVYSEMKNMKVKSAQYLFIYSLCVHQIHTRQMPIGY
jgi:hypothetical protein